MKATSQSGFTLWELLITLLVAGVLFGIGVPNMMEFQRNGLITAAANQVITGVLSARTEAVKRQAPVTLCASPNPTAVAPTCSPNGAGSNGGFIVWVDSLVDANGIPIITPATDGNAVVDPGEQILMQTAAPGGTINVWGDSGYIAYLASGFRRTTPAAGAGGRLSASRLLFCDDRGNRATSGQLSTARALRIDATGRGQVVQTIAEVTEALGIITASGVAAVCP